jgi:hypothetical protein
LISRQMIGFVFSTIVKSAPVTGPSSPSVIDR